MPTVVLIEDDRSIAEPLVRTLKGLGYNVLSAFDGVSGLELALNREPDLVILDIMLPEMDGWEVCKAIRKTSVVPILMLTALTDEVDRIVGLELGADCGRDLSTGQHSQAGESEQNDADVGHQQPNADAH